jgi:hypothetical protein
VQTKIENFNFCRRLSEEKEKGTFEVASGACQHHIFPIKEIDPSGFISRPSAWENLLCVFGYRCLQIPFRPALSLSPKSPSALASEKKKFNKKGKEEKIKKPSGQGKEWKKTKNGGSNPP